MAKKVANRGSRNRKTGSNALVKDYEKLAIELWKKPATRYVLGGAEIAILVPFAMRMFPRFNTLIRDNMDTASDKWDEVEGMISERISEIKSRSQDEYIA